MKAQLDQLLLTGTTADWAPLPGPQTDAYLSKADVMLYGGAAGGGKTDLQLGLAGTLHHRSVIFRRVFPSLRAIIDRSREMFNASDAHRRVDSYNESLHRWKFGGVGNRQLEFGSLQYEKDVLAHQGQARDYHGFDEVTEFTEYQFRYIIGWNRPLTFRDGKHQRCRVVATSNPPTTSEGRWIINYWSPWLDDHYPKPAAPGELRWVTTINNKDTWVDGPDPVQIEVNGKKEWVKPKSRTFILAKVQDNPYLVEAGYIATLQAMPEPLRSILLYGDFKAGIEDDPWQLIPTDWVRKAQQRWREQYNGRPPKNQRDGLGVDVSRGGRDRTVITPRYGSFFGDQVIHQGGVTKDGNRVAQLILKECDNEWCTIAIDVIGVGTSPYDAIKTLRMTVPLNGAEATTEKDRRTGRLGFRNKRSLWYWRLREALDPINGDPEIAIPDDPELLADLTAPKWELTRQGIAVESKEDIYERIQRSPDKGDSLVYAAIPIGLFNANDLIVGGSVVTAEGTGSPWGLDTGGIATNYDAPWNT